jgi:hypothetical protein
MSTAVALQELRETRALPISRPLDDPEWQAWAVECPPKRRAGSVVVKAVKWASILGLFALAGLWSRFTPFEVVARFIVDAGAILVMAEALLARHYAIAAVSGALVLLFNPLAPVFGLSGDWQRAALVAGATPFLVSLFWRDIREPGNRRRTAEWRRLTNMLNNTTDNRAFREGDEVVLADGPYQGTQGVFVRFGNDVKWADINERNGRLWSHPVAWLAHSPIAVAAAVN